MKLQVNGEPYELPESAAPTGQVPPRTRKSATLHESLPDSEPQPDQKTRTTFVEEQLPYEVQEQARALYGQSPARRQQATGPPAASRSHPGQPPVTAVSAPADQQAETTLFQHPGDSPNPPEDDGGLWKAIAVALSILALAGIWIVFLMLTSAM